ncbi:glycoside hydrolase family 127 protein [Paenibacillus frigoriresistens]|uniref:glycoside hydrolase family 127 protein n=1 Tax=Paenibacillus alginolyticus TaxID=59839 RepID=UPI00156426EB|nr:beta-L-arabinofuranosidase domain-containing protein [Paenibacillus frigoriresistens]NRF93759.1 glycoside hydrolase family 127 protein [Paenibacillus frigoriresistens]
MKKLETQLQHRLQAAPLKHVKIQDAFWSARQRNVIETVVPYQWDALNDAIPGAEPSHTIENFRLAAGEAQGEYYGMVFQDSDLGKWLETVGFVLSIKKDPTLEKIADDVIDLLGRAQQPDGYLNTYYTVKDPGNRWTNLRDNHELYCAGHLMEAAVSYYEATGKRKILDIMSRYADYIASVFGTQSGQKRGYDGHPEIELALVKLAQATASSKYLELSKYFVDERGQQPHFFDMEAKERESGSSTSSLSKKKRLYDYFQAHLPVREQKTAEGHSVRAVYLYSAMADLASDYNDAELMNACKELWKDTVSRKMYVTGGIGSSAYEERFTVAYDLPNDRAYTETCAAIGLMFWAYRMLQIEKDSQYADVMELALYNGVLSGISLDGKSYFYVNPLEVWPDTADFRNDMSTVKVTRQPWFGCACCPPNIARLIASLGQYIYSSNETERELYVHLYIGSELNVDISGKAIRLTQQTNYPWDGQVNMELALDQAAEFTLALRIPGWCRKAVISVNGQELVAPDIANGYALLRRVWQHGDQIQLTLETPVEVVRAHPLVRANAGKIALQRGPIVYCLEEADNGANLQDIALPDDAQFDVQYDEGLLGGVSVITTLATRSVLQADDTSIYRTQAIDRALVPITAIPYFAWSNRTRGEMTVWIRSN